MANPYAIKRKLSRKVIDGLGLDTVFLRSKTTAEKDAYGEPIESPWPFTATNIRITIDTDRRDAAMSDVGGLPDPKKEYLYFYCKGGVDIRTNDKIIYPAKTDHQWTIDLVEPMSLKGVVVITEVKAYRDARY